jgi:hypothetical protein
MHIVKSVKVCQGLTKISANDGRHCEPPLAAKFEIGYYRRGRGSLPFVYREAGQNVKADRTLPLGAGVAALRAMTSLFSWHRASEQARPRLGGFAIALYKKS